MSDAAPRPLTPETLVYGFSLAGDPQLSPDGRQIAYTLTAADRESKQATSHLWCCDRDGGHRRRLTWSGARNGGARWSPDGRQIAFVSDRVTASGLFLLPVAGGGEACELVRHGQPISDLAWSPDGARIAYVVQVDPANPDGAPAPPGAAPRPRVTRRLDYKADGRGYLGDARRQVCVVDVASGARRQLTQTAADHAAPQWSPDGRWLAAHRLSRGGICSQLALIEVATGETALVGPEPGVAAAWAWSPAGDRLLIAGDDAQSWHWDLFLYEPATGARRRLVADPPWLVEGSYGGSPPPSAPVWLDERRVLLHGFRGGASGLYVVDCEHGSVEPLANWPAVRTGLSVDAARRYAVQAHASLEAAGEIAVVDLHTGASRLVTRLNAPLLAEAPPARWERFEVQRGGLTIDAWLLRPQDFDPGRRYPVVLDVHGGPHNFYGYRFNPVPQCLATHGFLVVYANPRGSGTYGRRFAQAVIADWGGEDYLDLLAVVDAVTARPEADPARVGIYGSSYGGYMTAWAIGQSDRFRAAVCGAPVFDLESFYGTSDVGYAFGELEFGGPPHARREWYAAHSPSTFAHRARTPTLIVHGEADDRCPIGQAEQMFVALAQAGCEVELVRYPGGAHGFSGSGPAEHRVDYLARTLAWFKRHLGEPS